MSTNITLSKESSEREIKAYFNEILKLSQSDNEFPVNFDDVWMLVYQDKHKAVNELKEKFIESVDYQAITQKVKCQNGIGYSRRIDYHITVPCLEFFIARKVRSVFEVYRQVFHHTVNKIIENKSIDNQPTISDKMNAATWAAKFLNLIIKREFPCLQAGDDSAFVHTFFWLSMYFLTISSDICPTDSTK